MEKRSSSQEEFNLNFVQFPPAGQLTTTPTSHSQGKVYKPRTRTVKKDAKPSPKEGIKQIEPKDEAPTKAESAEPIPTKDLGVEDASPGIETTARDSDISGAKACQNDSNKEGAPNRGLAKSHLYEICATHQWKPPLFECCKEEGPSHMKLFTFKVIIEMKEELITVLECFGAPRSKKKTAAEHAAEGALWYLKHQGYFPNK